LENKILQRKLKKMEGILLEKKLIPWFLMVLKGKGKLINWKIPNKVGNWE